MEYNVVLFTSTKAGDHPSVWTVTVKTSYNCDTLVRLLHVMFDGPSVYAKWPRSGDCDDNTKALLSEIQESLFHYMDEAGSKDGVMYNDVIEYLNASKYKTVIKRMPERPDEFVSRSEDAALFDTLITVINDLWKTANQPDD